MGHKDYQNNLVKAWWRWRGNNQNFGIVGLQRDILSIWTAVSLRCLQFFLYIYFYFLEDRPAICVYVQYEITARVYFILFFPRFVFNLIQRKAAFVFLQHGILTHSHLSKPK